MKLTVNGDLVEVEHPLTIRQLLERLQLTEGPVAIEHNRSVVLRANHETTALEDGDTIEIVHFVGGG